jgi:hypothetical protein
MVMRHVRNENAARPGAAFEERGLSQTSGAPILAPDTVAVKREVALALLARALAFGEQLGLDRQDLAAELAERESVREALAWNDREAAA